VTLRQHGAGADASVTGSALVALYDRTFLLGQSLIPVVNGLLLGSLMYRSRLVPRVLPMLGLIGAPLLLAAQFGVLFDLWDRTSAFTAIGALPIAIWEFSLGVYLVVRGFRPEGLAKLDAPALPASA
jgi:Na+/H+ antiporter NhaD/arsenite permease-like protein